MNTIARHRLGHAFVGIAAAALLAACAAEAPVGPDRRPALHQAPALGDCDSLEAPAGSELAAHTYAQGVQIYRWNGTSWAFVAPSAVLTADASGLGTVGTHYAGPTWESVSGSKVVAAALKRCTPDASAIPWLLLGAVSSEGPGIFEGTTHIQRVNTVGGLAPAAPGSVVGERREVPYTAEYFFYRAQ